MAYATRADIEAIYGVRHLETLVPSDVDMDTAVANAIESAGAMIDPYLRKRYVLPITVATPAILKQCAIDIACWQLAPAADRMSEEIEKRAKLRLAFLVDVAKGNAEIVELTPVAGGGSDGAGATSGGGAFFTAEPRRWTGGALE
ncbi:phage protein Gp36 family protein [Bosea sp. TAB14]|uniref:phage protein Gp36 family protein n=1 Tax=Bosea sp. TAB14 TaxID=3237481 RepID=UPI003F8FDA65